MKIMTRLEKITLKVAREANSDIHAVFSKMMKTLPSGTVYPKVKIVSNVSSNWLGRCLHIYGEDNNTIELQKNILGHQETLERIVAHELCHHISFLEIENEGKEKGWNTNTMKLLHKMRGGHGSDFDKWSKAFNSVYGSNFVTETSDEAMVKSEFDKDILLLLYKARNKISWSFTVRPSQRQKDYIDEKLERKSPEMEYKLTKTRDSDFGLGAPVGSGFAHSRDENMNKKLEELWNNGANVKVAKKLESSSINELASNFNQAWKHSGIDNLGNCDIAAGAFYIYLLCEGIKNAEVVKVKKLYPVTSNVHYSVLVGNVVYDFTITQFDDIDNKQYKYIKSFYEDELFYNKLTKAFDKKYWILEHNEAIKAFKKMSKELGLSESDYIKLANQVNENNRINKIANMIK